MTAEERRLDWIDAAKGIGILFMIYGHALQKGFRSPGPAVVDQMRVICSFNMPMFFMLSGFFYRPVAEVARRVLGLVQRRLAPVLFFSALTVPLWLKVTPWHAFSGQAARDLTLALLQGHPELNWVMWFMVCLLVTEIGAQLSLRLVPRWGLPFVGVACVLLFASAGTALMAWSPRWGDVVYRFWFVGEAGVALGFYALGIFALPWFQRISTSRLAGAVLFVAGATALLALSQAWPANPPSFLVTLAVGQHGDAASFLVKALLGTAAAMGLGMAFPRGFLSLVGRNSVALLGLNGVFFHFVYPSLAHHLPVAEAATAVAVRAAVATLATLVVCCPAVILLNRWLPSYVGRRRRTESAPRGTLATATVPL